MSGSGHFCWGLNKVFINWVYALCSGGSEWLFRGVLLVTVSRSWFVHGDFVLWVHVNSKADCVAVKIINRIEVLQESVTDQEKVLVLPGQSALMNDKVTLLMAWFIKVLFWVNFENVVAHLEADWFHLWSNLLAALLHVAECFVGGAIEIWQSLCPFLSNFFKNIWRNWKLRWSSIYDSWIRGVFTWFLHCFTTIVHTLTFKGPSSEPILEILKCFKSFGTSDDLCRVITSE